MMIQHNPRGQAGFTLIEIAIVLVIIGLLLGGVLQGQQLIENSRVRSATNDINGIAAGAFSYQERYGRLPGDDPGATSARGSNWSRDEGGNGDGQVGGDDDVTFIPGPGSEIAYFFQDLRSAGFINGDHSQPGIQALPQNPFGGLTSVTNAPILTTPPESGGAPLGGLKVCMNNVPGSSAMALDSQLDDGNPATGRFRATSDEVLGDTNEPPSTYNEDLAHIVCYRI